MAIHSVTISVTATGDPNEASGVAETAGVITGELIDVEVHCVGENAGASCQLATEFPDAAVLDLTGSEMTGLYIPLRQRCDRAGSPLDDYVPWLFSSKLFGIVNGIAANGNVTTFTIRYKD